MAGAVAFSASSAPRYLIEKSGDAPDAPVANDGKIRTLDRTVGALGTQSPGKTDVVAITIGLADQLKPEIRKALLHAGDQRVDTVVAVAAHQRVDVFRIIRPVRGQHFAAATGLTFVPQFDIDSGWQLC